jgi:hypothetical protein
MDAPSRAVKNWLLTLLVAVALCAVSFAGFFVVNRETPQARQAARAGDAMEWMRAEFRLTEAQFAAIRELHDRYGAVCSEHCARIMAAEKSGASAQQVAALENECVQSMADHFHRVAALMAPEQAERYLSLVLPRIRDYDHRGAPNVLVRP